MLLAACAPPAAAPPPSPAQPLSDLLGQIVASRPGLVVPDHRWRTEGDDWLLDGVAGIVLSVRTAPADQVAVSFTSAADATAPQLELMLDGRPLTPATGAGDPVIEVHLPRQALTPGVHVLEVNAVGSEPVSFTELALHLGSHREVFRPVGRSYYAYLADYLTLGVAGFSPPQSFGGFLMMGSQKTAVEVPPGADRFVARVHNVSPAPASMSVGSAGERVEQQVEPWGEASLELPLGGREPTIELEAQGSGDGLYHWSVSRFVDTDAEPATPLILISLDTTRRDAVAPWSENPTATPHLAALSEVASVFDSATSTAPWTLPSHASMFTGQYPSRHGAGVIDNRLGLDQETVAELLSRRGYVNGGFGAGPFTSHRFGLARGFALYQGPAGWETPADRLTDAALAFLDRHGDDPFFLFVNYFDPHFPFRAPPRFDGEALADARRTTDPGGGLGRLLAGNGVAWRDLTEGRLDLEAEAVARLSEAYRAEVAFMDEQIGRLIDALAARDLFEKAWIVVIADHGELLGEGGFFNHGCRLDPELIRIPMMVKRPGQRQQRRIAAPVSSIDVFATLLTAAGVEVPPGDAVALDSAALDGARRRAVHSEEHEQSVIHPFFEHMKISPHLLSIEERDRRRILWPGDSLCQILDGGGWQSRPCADGGPAYGDLGRRLAGGDRASRQPGQISQQEADRLRALGYLE